MRRIASSTSALGLITFMAVIRFLQVGGVGTATTFFNVYLDNHLHVATSYIGLFQALAKFVGIPIALMIPWLTHRFGNGRTVLMASSVVVLAMLPLAFVPVWWVAGLGYIGVWAVTPVRYAAFMVYVMERSPERLRGSMNGAQELAGGLSFTLIALSGGYLIATAGYSTLFGLGALLTLAGMLLFWHYQQKD